MFNKPVEAIKTPVPVLSTDNSPFWFITEPETLTAPSEFTSKVFPLPLLIVPEILIPLEPEFVISVLPLLKFFIVPAIAVPPSAPYDLIIMLPLSFTNSFAVFKLSVLTSFVNRVSA